MAGYQIQDLVARLSCDPSLRADMQSAATIEEALRVAAEHGLSLDREDLRTLSVAGSDPASLPGALTDADLEQTAAGTANPFSFYICGPTEVLCTAGWACH